MKQVFCFLLLCLHSTIIVHAQHRPAPPDSANERIVQQATFIFEGQVVKTVEQFQPERQRIYRSSAIQISQVLNGALLPGAVQVVYQGPKTQSAKTAKASGALIYSLPDCSHCNPADYGLVLPSQQSVLFFCRQLPSSYAGRPQPLRGLSNPAMLEVLGIGYELPGNGSGYISDIGGTFASKKAFLDYMAARYPSAMPTKTDTEKKSSHSGKALIESHRQEVASVKKELVAMKAALDARKSQLNSSTGLSSNRPLGTATLEMTIQNIAVTGSAARALEYDVFVRSTWPGWATRWAFSTGIRRICAVYQQQHILSGFCNDAIFLFCDSFWKYKCR